MFRLFILSLLAFIAGTVLVYLVVVISVFTFWEVTGAVDRDGGRAMGLIFMLGPAFAIPGGVISASLTWRILRERAKTKAPAI